MRQQTQRKESKKGVLSMATRRSLRLALVILSVIGVLLLGCGKESTIVSPDLEKKEPTPLPLPPLVQSELLSSSGSNYTQVLIIAATGGKVKLGFCEVIIPPGALLNDTVISIAYADPYYAIFDMGPDGTQFAAPVTIRFDIEAFEDYLDDNDIDVDDLIIALRSEIDGMWLPLDTFVEEQDHHTWVETFTWHFSRYALAD
ncbi:MAG: hypothetical protein ACUVUU_02755 [bacterium]